MSFYPNHTLGFFGDTSGLDLYNEIDKWYDDYVDSFSTREISWAADNTSIYQKLNQIASTQNLSQCFPSNVTISDLRDVALDWNLSTLDAKILKTCPWLNKDNSISVETLNKYNQIAIKEYNDWVDRAETKIDKIYSIWSIWLFSDWNEDNSPFDIISDLEWINDIVFNKKLTYKWENTKDLSDEVDNFINSWDTSTQTSNVDNSNDTTTLNDANTDVCSTNNTPLDSSSAWLLLWLTWSTNANENNENQEDSLENETVYSPVNDNDLWPCTSFFCITIEFVTHTQDLLWSSENTNSLEYLISRSNNHLKPFASTSLVQSKMTTNNFELWLSNLSLPDLFHFWVELIWKPVPIKKLDMYWEDSFENWDFSSKNLLNRYYKNLWLNYNRANDLNIFNNTDYESLSINKAAETTMVNASDKNQEYINILNNQSYQNDYVSNTVIDNYISWYDLNWFLTQFAQVNWFVSYLTTYTEQLENIIKWMKNIPQTK